MYKSNLFVALELGFIAQILYLYDTVGLGSGQVFKYEYFDEICNVLCMQLFPLKMAENCQMSHVIDIFSPPKGPKGGSKLGTSTKSTQNSVFIVFWESGLSPI